MSTKMLVLDWDKHYRTYILEAGLELGLKLYFVLEAPALALLPYAEDIFILPRLYENPIQWVDDIVAYARRHRIEAIFTHEDLLVELAARVSKRLGLPGPSPESVHLAKNKWATRERLSQVGLPQPTYQCVTSLPEARAAIDKLCLPVVIKPIGYAGGQGASKLMNINGLDRAWKIAYQACLETGPEYHKVIIEEFMPGPLVSVEVAVIDGTPIPIAATDGLQVEIPDDEFCTRFAHTGLVLPSTLDENFTSNMMRLAEETILSLNIETGIVHMELKCTSQGAKVVEVNPRLPGVFVPELIHRALGINWAKVAMLLALGQKPDLTIQHRKGTCVRLLLPPAEGIIEKILGFEEVVTAPHVVRAILWVSEGDYIVPPNKGDIEERLGYIMTEDVGPAKALAAAEYAEKLLSIHLRSKDNNS